jgi:glycosyltransferase involved in cell wall biosynthesis
MVRELGIAVVHQPTPVSPRMPSLLHTLGAPVVMGPMNGNMSFPPAFRRREHAFTRWTIQLLRQASGALHWIMPGKRRAAILLVANERTRQALPASCRGEVMHFCENGVDLATWDRIATTAPPATNTLRVAFSGRLIELKGVDLLLEAAAEARRQLGDSSDLELNIIGDGEITAKLREHADHLGLNGSVRFHGWQPHAVCARKLASMDALAMPSLCECGGAAVLEAMALGLPVIASKWGGPADYVDSTCGMLVEPTSRSAFITGFAEAMVRLAESPDLRRSLGEAGHEKVRTQFDWQVRIDQIISVYHRAARRSADAFEQQPEAALAVAP